MIKDGEGGSNTKTGLIFENKSDIRKLFKNNVQYELTEHQDGYFILSQNSKEIAIIAKKYNFYKFLATQNINWKHYLSKRLLPDETIFVIAKKCLNIIEIKYQQVAGSVDEKLQTCDFKCKQYQKLVSSLDWSVNYIYILNDWFKKPEYKDTLEYIKSSGCKYYFNKLDLTEIGL